MTIDVSPEPTEEELAAILAAYEALRPQPDLAVVPARSPRWRFASRPWIRRSSYRGWR